MEKQRARKGEQGIPQGKRKAPKPPKFNFMWIYAIIFAIIIGFQLLNNFGSSPVTITKGRFMKKMLVSGDVEMVKAYQEAGEYKRSEERRVGKEGDSTCKSRWSP